VKAIAERIMKFLMPALMALVIFSAFSAVAEDRTFLGQQIEDISGTYLVTKDVNIRAMPETKSKKLGSMKSGEQATVVGRAKGGAGWMAITKDGKDFGFVYSPVLLPILDGTLSETINGRVEPEIHSPCGYTIRFKGKNVVEGESFMFSDYEVQYRCNDKGKPFQFLAPMFMTELPYKMTQNPVYQISIDVMQVENGYDEIFSTTFHYDRDKKLLIYEGLSIKEMGRQAKIKERAVTGVAEALAAVVELAPEVWNEKAWQQIAEAQLGEGG